MAQVYRRPPLIEVVCQIRLQSSVDWSETIPETFYSQIREEFPYKRDLNSIHLTLDLEGKQDPREVRSLKRIQFYNEAKTQWVQLGPSELVVNLANSYKSWDDYKTLVLSLYKRYENVANPEAIIGAGLRYINRIDLRGLDGALDDYLNYLPAPLHSSPMLVGTLLMRTDYILQNPRGTLSVTLATQPDTDHEMFLLDFDFKSTDEDANITNLNGWLDTAHKNIEDAFEASITPQLKEIYGKEV